MAVQLQYGQGDTALVDNMQLPHRLITRTPLQPIPLDGTGLLFRQGRLCFVSGAPRRPCRASPLASFSVKNKKQALFFHPVWICPAF